MTEAEWTTCAQSGKMLKFLDGKVSQRKLRLFACACCRWAFQGVTDTDVRQSILTTERYADGLVGAGVLAPVRNRIKDRFQTAICTRSRNPLGTKYHVLDAALRLCSDFDWEARFVECITGSCWFYLKSPDKGVMPSFLRCIFGPTPFCPVTFDPVWLTSAVQQLAAAIYEERAFDRMPILGDAMEEAGCSNADILCHCRQPGEHVRGCWVVDLILGKS